VNDAVSFGAVHSLAASAAGSTISASLLHANGVVAPTPIPQAPPFNTTGLPPDGGVGGNVSFVARIGPCTTVATCALMPPRTTTVGLAETNSGFDLGAIVQSVDAFGNVTNPPSTGANFALLANPLDPVHPYVVNGVLFIGIDRTLPNVISRGAGGSNTPGTTFTPNTIQGTSAANFDFVAEDVVPVGLIGMSGILFQLPGSELYVHLSRRDGATTQYFCPLAGNYLPFFADACPSPVGTAPGWNDGGVMYARGAGSILSDPSAHGVRAYYWAFVFTRDQAGNQSNGQSRNFIYDNTPPSSFGQAFAPSVFPVNGPLVFSGSAFEDLDVGRGAFSVRFPSLSVAAGAGADFIRFPWAVKSDVNSLSNPVGYNVIGPSALALQFTTTWPSAIRSIEVVTAGDNSLGPTIAGACAGCGGFTIGALPGEIQFPGGLNGGGVPIAFVQDGNLANGAGPTQYNFFAQSVSRVGLTSSQGPTGIVPGGQGTALTFAQTGMPNAASSPAAWSSEQGAGAGNPSFNMQWAMVNPTAGNLDLSGNGTVNFKIITAVAFFPNGAPVTSPFSGGVRFYAIDTRQPLNIDNAGSVAAGGQPAAAGIGASLVEIPCTVSAASVGPIWQYQCAYAPSSGGATSMLIAHDFAGFNFPSSANLMVNYVGGVPTAGAVPNQGFWGSGQISGPAPFSGFNQGWQGSSTVGAITPGTIIPVIAIGCNGSGNCLATRLSTNAGFAVQP
jgi:hypothetical protein